MGFSGGSVGKGSACSAGDLGLIPGLERSPGAGKDYPLQYSGPENPRDYNTVHRVAKTQTQLSDLYFRFHSHLGFLTYFAKSRDIVLNNYKINFSLEVFIRNLRLDF